MTSIRPSPVIPARNAGAPSWRATPPARSWGPARAVGGAAGRWRCRHHPPPSLNELTCAMSAAAPRVGVETVLARRRGHAARRRGGLMAAGGARVESAAPSWEATQADAPCRSGNCLPARRQPSLSRGIVELASSRAEPREAEAVNAILPGQDLVGAERVAAAGLIQR